MQQFSWLQFEDRLARALMRAGDRVHIALIPEVSTEYMTQYLHYIVSDTAIVCELRLPTQTRNVSSVYKSSAISAMVNQGWQQSNENEVYSRHLPLPTYSSAYASLAAQSIHILRDILQIGEPTSLTYYAWRAPEELEEGRYYSAEEVDELDEGEDPLEVDLGIEMASRRPEI
ncbi:TY-Chap domain-containing protein [Actinomyces oris]|uniref:TY-Chap domain-containing protein n=1 Tax=Actinomyces oris TaxID=544580 RepID=UPI000A4CAD39|nr:hypothetical protein [Actinomyces oris]